MDPETIFLILAGQVPRREQDLSNDRLSTNSGYPVILCTVNPYLQVPTGVA